MGPPGLPLFGFPLDGFPPCPGFGRKSATGPPVGLVPLGPLYAGPSFLEVPDGLGLLLCILGPPLGASEVGPLPPRPGGGGIGRPDLDLGAGGGGMGFPEDEIGGDLGFTCPVFSLSGFSFGFFSCS